MSPVKTTPHKARDRGTSVSISNLSILKARDRDPAASPVTPTTKPGGRGGKSISKLRSNGTSASPLKPHGPGDTGSPRKHRNGQGIVKPTNPRDRATQSSKPPHNPALVSKDSNGFQLTNQDVQTYVETQRRVSNLLRQMIFSTIEKMSYRLQLGGFDVLDDDMKRLLDARVASFFRRRVRFLGSFNLSGVKGFC